MRYYETVYIVNPNFEQSRLDAIIKDVENNEAIKTGNVDENAKKQFLKGADIAYEQIVIAFAKGDKKLLKTLKRKQ